MDMIAENIIVLCHVLSLYLKYHNCIPRVGTDAAVEGAESTRISSKIRKLANKDIAENKYINWAKNIK